MGRPRKNRDTSQQPDEPKGDGDDARDGDVPELDADEECRFDSSEDGSFAVSRRRRAPADVGDRESYDVPDEPPPGWCES